MTTPHTTPAAECPKRVWVLQALSDDEAHAGGDLPQGLRFHLGRCPSCRELSERLTSTTTALAGLAAASAPTADFSAAARARVLDALQQGAPLTGRVTIVDEPMAEPPARHWRVYATMAAAAALAFAATVWVLRDTAQPALTDPAGAYVGATQDGASEPAPAPDAASDPESPGVSESRVATASELPPVRRYTNPVDAAFSNDNGSVQAAFTLPPPRGGGLSALIDRMRGHGSTGANPPPQQP
jgi:hypothetical protein